MDEIRSQGDVTPEQLAARTQQVSQMLAAVPELEPAEAVLPAIGWQGAEDYRPLSQALPDWHSQMPLPKSDVVIITWTAAEWAALDHVFCGYDTPTTAAEAKDAKAKWREGWLTYARDYYRIHQYMVGVKKLYEGGAPSLARQAWGLFRLVRINGLTVLLVKSEMHLAQDGTDLPLLPFVERICEEAGPRLVLSIGTAGGVREEDALGSALVTNQALFHLVEEFSSASFNGTTVRSDWQPGAAYLDKAGDWLLQVEGFSIYPVSPQYPDGAVIRPNAPDSRIKLMTDQPIITTDKFLFGTTKNGLEKLGCIVEMDDAVVGMACQRHGVPFGFVRNVSDPVINGRLPEKLQDAWAGYIYQERGLLTSYNGALAAWALVAAESDRH